MALFMETLQWLMALCAFMFAVLWFSDQKAERGTRALAAIVLAGLTLATVFLAGTRFDPEYNDTSCLALVTGFLAVLVALMLRYVPAAFLPRKRKAHALRMDLDPGK